MPSILVVRQPRDWPLHVPGVEVVSAKAYLTDSRYSQIKNLKVFNLCRSYRYQSNGYYVSLLAAARGHRPIPDISTLQDMRFSTVIKIMAEDLDEIMESSFRDIRSNEFVLSIYFGKNVAKKYDRLALRLFNMFEAPLIRAVFVRHEKWELKQIAPIPASEIPESHRPFVIERATEYFGKKHFRPSKKEPLRYDLAILHDPEEQAPPSDERALKRFMRAAEKLGFSCELITRDDYGRLAEFDALFIRVTTRVNHYTYRFARRAEAEGLVVIDDSESIIRCSNKVYLAEILNRLKIATPPTMLIHRDNLEQAKKELEFPCVLKVPDSAFSQGVIKVESPELLEEKAEEFFRKSDLIVAQEFVPTTFDWRIGIIDRKPLYACKYYMARNHWQIIKNSAQGESLEGKTETMPVEQAPAEIVDLALRATAPIGSGFYGVDIKQFEDKCFVIEVNDNPSIDAGYEDLVLKDALYERIMRVFLERLENRREKAKKNEPNKNVEAVSGLRD